MTPGQALTGLRDALAAHGITTAGMTLTRRTGKLHPSQGPAIGYHHGLYWWAARRADAARPLYATHDARDPAGAARRITAIHPRTGTTMTDTIPAHAHTTTGHTTHGKDEAGLHAPGRHPGSAPPETATQRSTPPHPDGGAPATAVPGIMAPDGHLDPRELTQVTARQFMIKTASRNPDTKASTLLRDLWQARTHIAALLALSRTANALPIETGQPQPEPR